MEQVIFKDNWQSYFADRDLRSLDDFFAYADGKIINQNTKRNVTVMTFPDGNQTKTFYMKRFFDPHFKDMLFTLGNFGKICSQAELEWRCANILLDNGIETYHPVGYGFRSVCSIERQSFFITEAIDGVCLLDYLVQNWTGLPAEKQESLVVKLAHFFAKIHAARLSLPDSYIWHVYMVNTGPGDEDYEFGMIDLHRMKRRTRGSNQAAMNLGRFFYSLPDGFLDIPLQSRFTDTYLAAGTTVNTKAFLTEVEKNKVKFLKRRKKTVDSLNP